MGVGAARIWGRSRVCGDGVPRFAAIWELDRGDGAAKPRRTALQSSIERSGVSQARQIWERFASVMDKYEVAWLGAYREACEATHVRREQSEDVLDLRMACLSDELDSARVVTDLVAGGERGVVEGATNTALGLGDASRCADVAQLKNGILPPRDPALAKTVAAFRARLREAEARYQLGSVHEAWNIAKDVLSRSRTLGYDPLLSEALSVAGSCAVPWTESVPLLKEAVVVAERCRHDRVVARAASGLAYGLASTDSGAADGWAALADAAIVRIGDDARLRSWFLNDRAFLRCMEGRFDLAVADARASVRLKEKVLGANHPDVRISLFTEAWALERLGKLDEALVEIERSVSIADAWPGSGLSTKASLLQARAELLLALGRIEDAESAWVEVRRMAVIMGEAGRGPVAWALSGLARVELKAGRNQDALNRLDELESAHVDDLLNATDAAEIQFARARALAGLQPRDASAVGWARKALTGYGQSPAYERERREIRAWLRAHAS
jgi:tetratricopeptide (TPR) repeat protein